MRPKRLRNALRRPSAPRDETPMTKSWCEKCRSMHDIPVCLCRPSFHDCLEVGEVCNKCNATKEKA